jgi:hypothetical protein
MLGKAREVIGFRHGLIGKFLAARHLHRAIRQEAGTQTVDYLALSAEELWSDVFHFVVDEIDSPSVLNRFAQELLAAGGRVRLLIVAYAIATKPERWVTDGVKRSHEVARMAEDLVLTPAG